MRKRTGEDDKFYLCPVCKAEVTGDDASCYICGKQFPEFEDEEYDDSLDCTSDPEAHKTGRQETPQRD